MHFKVQGLSCIALVGAVMSYPRMTVNYNYALHSLNYLNIIDTSDIAINARVCFRFFQHRNGFCSYLLIGRLALKNQVRTITKNS